MKAVFISEIEDHIILTLDMDRAELAACVEDGEDGAGALTKAVLAACRASGALPEPSPVVSEQAAPEPPRAPFRAEHYKGVHIQRVHTGENGLSPEDIMRERLLDAVIARNDIYIPEEQIASEVDYAFVGRAQSLKYQGIMTGDYTQYQSYGSQEDREQVEREVVRQLKVDMILKSIIEQEGITATREELEIRAREVAQRQNTTLEMIERFFGKDFGLLESDLIKEKALELIYQSAIITE